MAAMRSLGVIAVVAVLGPMLPLACYVPPPVALEGPPPPTRATLLGTLWPPPDQLGFDVAGQTISVQSAVGAATEVQTDRLGHFEAHLASPGAYAVILVSDTHSASAEVAVESLSSVVRVDLVARQG